MARVFIVDCEMGNYLRHFAQALLLLLSAAAANAQSGVVQDFTAPKPNPSSPGDNYWEPYNGYCQSPQNYSIANGSFTMNCCPAAGDDGFPAA